MHILYARYSDPTQGKGKSLARQFGDMRDELVRLGLSDQPVREEAEKGRSGFHGHHRTGSGRMAAIEAEAADGALHGWTLWAEKLDRLSRQGYEETFDLIRMFLRNGVTIRTLDGEHYRAGEEITMVDIITGIVKADLARLESKNKADRTSSNWKINREKAKANKLAVTKLVPAWLIVNKDRTMKADPIRAALVIRMFEMADQGAGAGMIADTFTREGLATWERFKNRRAKVWQRTFINKILRNRAVIGEFTPIVKGVAEDPWPDHFPVIVDAALFARVNNAASVRQAAARGMRSEKVVNLFSSLVKCKCGATMKYARGRAAGTHTTLGGKTYIYKRDNGSLYCEVAHASKGALCANKTYLAYLTFEDALIQNCLHLAMDDQSFSNRGEVARLDTELAELSRSHELTVAKARKLWSAWTDSQSQMAMKLAQEAEGEAKAITAKIEALRVQRDAAAGRVSSEEHLARVADIAGKLYADDLEERVMVRRKVSQSLRSLIDRITYDGEFAYVHAAKGVLAFKLDRKGKVMLRHELFKPWVQHASNYERRRTSAIKHGSPLARQLKAAWPDNSFDHMQRRREKDHLRWRSG
jgi:CRISPR/Cas system CSM-associated protein Csm2 small subunit